MNKLVVTSGKKYIDIDGYAGCIAYSKLLNNIGYNSVAVTSANYNNSISSIIKDLNFKFDDYEPSSDDDFIILDVSNPDMFDDKAKMDKIINIIDHHTGFEDYCKKKGIETEIEFIGSICTIIFEKYEYYNKWELLDTNLCKLLIAGILDNTLNLKASITTERDKKAYNKLLEIGNINENWSDEYFLSCQKAIEQNLERSIINDIKVEYVGDTLPNVFGQLLVFDKTSILEEMNLIKSIFNKYGTEWLLNLISLKDGKSYIIAETSETRNKLELFFNTKFQDNILVLNKFMLRKEIMKKARERKQNSSL